MERETKSPYLDIDDGSFCITILFQNITNFHNQISEISRSANKTFVFIIKKLIKPEIYFI